MRIYTAPWGRMPFVGNDGYIVLYMIVLASAGYPEAVAHIRFAYLSRTIPLRVCADEAAPFLIHRTQGPRRYERTRTRKKQLQTSQ